MIWPAPRSRRANRVDSAITPDGATRDRGFTLIEVLIAVVLLGLGVVAMLGGLATAVIGSGLHRTQTNLDAALVTAAETVKIDTYAVCAAPPATQITYNATPSSGAFSTWPTNPAAIPTIGGYFLVTVQFWNGTSPYTVSAANPCPPSFLDNEYVSIEALSADGKATQSLIVVKANRSD